MSRKGTYTDKLSASDQLDMEESIAFRVFNEVENLDADAGESLTEEQCADIGRRVLLMVLKKFRPDLVSK